ncbi:MAG: hypothetical protein DMG03_26765, partial [Acidobacteria bacterium]
SGLERLRALGYANGPRHDTDTRIDPKDRREVAARIAQVTSGELTGAALVSALEEIVRADPSNSQAHLRLGYARLQQGDCAHAEQEFKWAIDGGLPTADAHLGLATCLGRANDLAGAERVLNEAKRREPDNPVITANVGILQAAKGDIGGAIESLISRSRSRKQAGAPRPRPLRASSSRVCRRLRRSVPKSSGCCALFSSARIRFPGLQSPTFRRLRDASHDGTADVRRKIRRKKEVSVRSTNQ